MNPVIRAIGLAGATLALVSAPAAIAKQRETGEEKLAKLLEGRVAGEPENCISEWQSRNMRVIDGTALVYGRGDTIYVNRTRNPQDIDRHDLLVFYRFGSQLCRLDRVTTTDRISGFYTGNIFLTDFVPYTRVKKDEGEDG
jgi:hypothetical protein